MEKETKYSNFILYSYWRASSAWRVRIALEVKGIEYVIKPINLLKKEHLAEDYLKINKHGKLPCLEFTVERNNQKEVMRIVESLAIIEFLEEIYPEKPSLLPRNDLYLKTQIKAFALHIACNIHPIQNVSVLSKVESLGQDKLEWGKHFVSKGLKTIEESLKETKGKFCFGDTVTLADVFLLPQLYFFKRNKLSLDEYPLIKEVLENSQKELWYSKSEPEGQIDAVN